MGAAQAADDEIALVAHRRGHRETGQGGVGDDERVFDGICQAAQPAAQDNAQFGFPAFQTLPQELGAHLYANKIVGIHRFTYV